MSLLRRARAALPWVVAAISSAAAVTAATVWQLEVRGADARFKAQLAVITAGVAAQMAEGPGGGREDFLGQAAKPAA